MREILFRGKHVHNDEWIYGYLVNSRWYLDDSSQTILIPTDVVSYPRCEISSWEEVDPNTVGQFTGMVDIEGRKIFEGDIMKTWIGGITQPNIGVVEFSDGAFGLRYTDGNGFFLCFVAGSCKVIGNIHDNPELMAEKE